MNAENKLSYNTASQIIIDNTAKFMNIAYRYAFNYEHDFIKKAGIEPADHMQRKFSALYEQYGATYGFIRFWAEMDSENQKALMTHILIRAANEDNC